MPRSNFTYFYELQTSVAGTAALYVFKFEHDFVLFTELYPRLSALDKSEAPAFTDGYTLGVTYAAILHTINSIMQIHNSVSCISQLGVPHRSYVFKIHCSIKRDGGSNYECLCIYRNNN